MTIVETATPAGAPMPMPLPLPNGADGEAGQATNGGTGIAGLVVITRPHLPPIRRYSHDFVERARGLVEGTIRTLKDIAAELHIGQRTLGNWIVKYDWQRPAGAPPMQGPRRRHGGADQRRDLVARLGDRPRQVVTTTPRPVPLIRRLLADDGTAVTRMSTRDNVKNLSPAFLSKVVSRYIGTRLGRQELDGELIEDRPDALWRRDEIEMLRVADAPALARIVVAVDPPASRRSGTCGIVAAGIDKAGFGYVLVDATTSGARPGEWAARALALWRRLQADALVVEVNQGGDMVAAVMREVDSAVPVKEVRATRGKWLRAEPVAALYEQGRVRHAGTFPELEDEMCDFGLDGLSAGRSPDRLDALVWALTALMLDGGGEPRVRGV